MLKKNNQIILWTALLFVGVFTLATAEVVDRIVAVVNNDIITLSQLNKATEPYKVNIASSQNLQAQKEELVKQLETDILQQLIDASLTRQEAVKYGIDVDDTDVDRAMDNFKKSNNLDQETLERGLAAEGLTIDEYREKLREQILQSMLVNRAVRSKVIITDSDVQKYYEANLDKFSGIKKYRLRNILTESEADIQFVEKKLRKKASFAALAKDYSIGSNASEGGDLGVFDINSFSQQIKTALENLNKGEFTSVMRTGKAYQIIYVADILMEGNLTVEQASDKIQEILYQKQAEQQFKEWINSLKESAHVKLML